MPRPTRKAAIVDAAVDLFAHKGYHATTVREIAGESGMLSGSLYAHIASKEDLLFEIVARAAAQFTAAVEPIARGPGTAGEKLHRAMAAHIQVVAADLPAATVFLHEWRALSPERQRPAAALRDRYEALIGEIIAEGVASGEFRPVDQKFARLLVLSAVNWLYMWYKPGGELGPDELAARLAALILQGLQAHGESGAPAATR